MGVHFLTWVRQEHVLHVTLCVAQGEDESLHTVRKLTACNNDGHDHPNGGTSITHERSLNETSLSFEPIGLPPRMGGILEEVRVVFAVGERGVIPPRANQL